MPRYSGDEAHVRVCLPRTTNPAFAQFVAAETRAGRQLELDDLIALRAVAERGFVDRWSASARLQLGEDESADRLISLRERGYLVPHGRGRGTSYRFARHLSDLLRGPAETDRDMPLDDEAIKLRIQAILTERGRITNAEVRRLSSYSRTEALRLMRSLADEGIVALKGRGRAAHYIPGRRLKELKAAAKKGKSAEMRHCEMRQCAKWRIVSPTNARMRHLAHSAAKTAAIHGMKTGTAFGDGRFPACRRWTGVRQPNRQAQGL